MEITKREIIASIAITCFLIIVGILIGNKLNESHIDSVNEYNKALKIKDTDLFEYAMKTNAGNAFIEGKLIALNPVSYDRISGKYLYVKEVKEKYVMKTKVVTTRVNGKTRTKVKTYWVWEEVDRSDKTSDMISFLDIKFQTSKINIPSIEYIETIKESSHIRYKYYGYPVESYGTIYTTLKNNTIENENNNFYKDKNIEETLDYLSSNIFIFIFWIVWIIVICCIVYYFCLLENDWLNK